MGDVLARMNQNRAFENHYAELQSITDKIVHNTKNLEGLLTTVRLFFVLFISKSFYSYSFP